MLLVAGGGPAASSRFSRTHALLRGEPELNRPITVSLPRTRLADALRALSDGTGVSLAAGRGVGDDWVTVIAVRRSAAEIVACLADVMHYSVRHRAPGDYLVALDPTVEAALSVLEREMPRIESRAQAALREAYAAGLDAAIGAAEVEPRGDDLTRDLLRSLAPEQRQAVAGVAARPLGVIGTHDSAHLDGRMFLQRPLSGFPGETQERLRSLFQDSPDARSTFASGGDPLVALTVHEGSVGLSLRSGDRTYNAPGTAIGGEASRAIRRERSLALSRLDADIAVAQRPEEGWLDPAAQPLPAAHVAGWTQRSVPLTLRRRMDATRLDRVLEAMAGAGGFAVVADGFARSSFQAAALGLTDRPDSRPPADWARHIARAFRREYRCRRGILLLRSPEWGRERYAEPPREVVERLEAARRERRRPTLQEYAAAVDRINPDQVASLRKLRTETDAGFYHEAATLDGRRTLLEFFAGLARAGVRLDDAGSASVGQSGPDIRRRFNELLYTGLPVPHAPRSDPPDLEWTTRDDVVHVLFRGRTSHAALHRVPLGP
jgi:hypothetical protein